MATNYFDELEERRKKILGESYKPISKTAIEKTNESFEERRQRILTQQPEKKPSQVAATEIKEEKKQSWFDKIKTGVKKAIDTINPKKKISEEAQTKPIADLQAQTGLDTTGLAINQKNILDSQIEKLKIEDQKQAVVSAQMTDYGKDRYSPEKQKELRQQRQEEVKAATRTELKEGYKEPKAFGQAVESLFQSTVGLASSLGAGSEMIGQMTGSVILTEAGQKIKLEADKVIASNPEWNPPEDQKWGVDKIARLVAASAPSLLGAVGAGMVAGPVGLFAYGAVMEGGATYGEAVDAGTEEGKAQIYGSVVGIVNGTIETIFPNELLSAPAKQAKKKITKKIVNKVVDGMVAFSKRFVKGGVQEGGEEFLQQLVSNTVATNYDENRKLWDDLLESFVGGSLTGGLLQQFEGRVTYPSTKIDMTPEAARESVEISDLKDTPAGEAILKVADEAETKNASVVIDLSGQDGDVVVTPDKNKVGVAIGSKIEPIVSQEEQVTSLEPLKQAETKEVVTSEVKTDSQIETAKQTLINEAKDYKTATEFATDKIFTDSLSGIEKQVLDSYEGETTADKLEALYKESKQTKEQPKEVTKVQEAETDIDMDELPAEVQQKAEEDWVDNYAEKYGKMEEEVRVLDRLIKEARADEREVLKAKRAEIVKRQGKMEEGFINKYQPKKKVVKKKVEKKKQKETEKLEKVNYDPEKLELNIYDPNTFGNPDPNKYEVQVRYKGFISDKAKFDTKKQAEDFVANYQFKGMTTNVAGDYMESRFFKETYLANVKVKPKKIESKKKYKTTINIQDKNDLEYLGRILSDDQINDIKKGKMTNWRGTPYEDVAKVNIVSETPKTIEQQLKGKIKEVKLKSDTFYHGTSAENASKIIKEGFKRGVDLPEETFRGGGYGKMQSSISFAETPKEASIFSTLTKNGEIIEAKLKDNAKVVSVNGIEDAIELEDYIDYLNKQKIDAVYIGGGEKELVVINPKALTSIKIGREEVTKPKVKVLKQPSKVDPKKVVAVLDKKQTKQLPVLQNVKVDNGKMIATDLKSYVILNTDKKDSGLFRLVGNDLVKSPDPIADFPDGPDLTKMKLKAEVLSENLIDVFSKTKLYIEKKDDRPTLTGVNIKIDKGIASITATDGFRLYNQEIGVKSTEKLDAIIPAKNLDNLIKLLGGGKVSIKADNDFISFTNTTGSVVVKTLVGDYPNINMVFNNNYEKTLVFDKKAFGDAVKQLEAIAKLNYNKVELSTEGNKLKLKTDVMIDDKKTDEKVVTVPISKQMKRKVKPGVLEGALVMPVRVGDGDIPNPEAGTYNYRYLLDVVKTIEGKDLYFDYQPNELQPLHISNKAEVPRVETKKAPSGTGDVGGYASVESLEQTLSKIKSVQFPELVRLARDMTGDVPALRKLRRKLGVFVHPGGLTGMGEIRLSYSIFNDPVLMARVLGHEIGHLNDYFDDKTLSRGNLAGRIASLRGYRKNILEDPTRGEVDNRVLVQELKELTQLWKPFDDQADPNFTKYRYSSRELYADALSVLFNDPALLKQQAPTFYQAFFDFIDEKPKAKEHLFKVWDMLNKDEEALFKQRDEDITRSYAKGEEAFYAKLLEKANRKDNILHRVRTLLDNVNYPVEFQVNQVVKKGEKLENKKNPAIELNALRYSEGKVKNFIADNFQPALDLVNQVESTNGWELLGKVAFLDRIINERGAVENPIEILQSVYGPEAWGDIAKNYLPKGIEKESAGEQIRLLEKHLSKVVSTNIDEGTLWDEVKSVLPKGIANPFGYDRKTATEQLDGYSKSVPAEDWDKLTQAQELFKKGVKAVVAEAEKNGYYSPELIKEMKANPAYATFQVLDYLETFITSKVYRSIGTLKDIANPATSTVMKSVSTIGAIERNNVKRTYVDFAKKYYANEIVEARTRWVNDHREFLPPKDKSLDLVVVIEDGKTMGYYLNKDIADSLNNASNATVKQTAELVRKLTRSSAYRAIFTTVNLGFMTTNFARDFMRTWKTTPNYTFKEALLSLPKQVLRYSQAIPHARARALKQQDILIKEMENIKALGATTFKDMFGEPDPGDKQIERVMKDLNLMENTKKRGLLGAGYNILETVSTIGDFIETLPKVATYIELKNKMPQDELANFIREKAGSPDFRKTGKLTPVTNNLFLFSNAYKEGIKTDAKILFKKPTTKSEKASQSGYYWKTVMADVLPKVLIALIGAGFLGDELKKMVDNISEYDKTNYNVIPLGLDENGKTIYLRMPQDDTGRFIGGLTRKMMTVLTKGELKNLAALFDYGYGQLPGLAPSLTSFMTLATYLSGRNPYDSYRGRYIVPEQAFEAGFKYSFPYIFDHIAKQQGAGIILPQYKLEGDNITAFQRTLNLPMLGNIVGRWIKVSDYGTSELDQGITEEIRKQKAKEGQERKKVLSDLTKKYLDGDRNMDRRDKLEEEYLVKAYGENYDIDEPKQTITNARKQFRIAVELKNRNDSDINNIIYAQSNDEKIELLNNARQRKTDIEYAEMVNLLLDNKVISTKVADEAEMIWQEGGDKKSGLLNFKLVKEAYAAEGLEEATGTKLTGPQSFAVRKVKISNWIDKLKEDLPDLLDKPIDYWASRLEGIVRGLEKPNEKTRETYKIMLSALEQDPVWYKENITPKDEKAIFGHTIMTDSFIKKSVEEVKQDVEEKKKLENQEEVPLKTPLPEATPTGFVPVENDEVEPAPTVDSPKATDTPYNDTIKEVFGDLWKDATKVLKRTDKDGVIRGENTQLLSGPEVDIENRIDPKTGLYDSNAPIKTFKNVFSGETENSIDRGLFRINNSRFYQLLNGKAERAMMIEAGIIDDKYSKANDITPEMAKEAWDKMLDVENNVKMAKILYDLNGNWDAWVAAPKEWLTAERRKALGLS